MKVLMLNGSCKKEGNTYNALLEIGKQLEKEGIDYEIFQTGSEPVRDCIGCGGCASGKCVYTDDAVNEFVEKARTADVPHDQPAALYETMCPMSDYTLYQYVLYLPDRFQS